MIHWIKIQRLEACVLVHLSECTRSAESKSAWLRKEGGGAHLILVAGGEENTMAAAHVHSIS